MRCAWVERFDDQDPLAGLRLGDRDVTPPAGWVSVEVVAAAANHHDIWSLRGVGLSADRLPMILGTDAAGIADGREVIVHAVVADPAFPDETLDPRRSILSERFHGTFAERVWVPERNLVDKHPDLSWEEAACLPTAYLTAWRMLTSDSKLSTGDTILVQGATGGVATAAVVLGHALGYEVWVTSRTGEGRAFALRIGAAAAFEPGARLPRQVDAVVESVGEATWAHSLAVLRPGGTVLVCGATTGAMPPAQLNRIFFRSLRVIGSTMGTRDELVALQDFVVAHVRPVISRVRPFADLPAALADLWAGRTRGKEVVLLPGGPPRLG